MAHPILIPRLTMTMESAELVEWYKQDGEAVRKGETLFAIETDKATQDVEAQADGIVYHRPDAPTGLVPVGTLIGYLAEVGEALDWALDSQPDSKIVAQGAAAAPVQAVVQSRDTGANRRFSSPAARRRAAELGIDWRSATTANAEGIVKVRDVEQAAQAQPAPATVEISPVARRTAAALGIEIEALAEEYPGQRISRADVEQFAQSSAASAAPTAEEMAPVGQQQALQGVRRVIAERMAQSAHSTAAVTLTTEADATELVRLRKELKRDSAAQQVPSYSDLLSKILAQALQEYPALNAHYDNAGIVQLESVNIGIAVDTERGLLVPVLHDVQRKSLRQIAQESAALIERTRSGKLQAGEMQGSSFTISNLGMYDIDAFTPIINLPDVAILGMGRIIRKLVLLDDESDEASARHMMALSLTFDHRAVDGAPAARFLQRVKQYVEQPYLWLGQ